LRRIAGAAAWRAPAARRMAFAVAVTAVALSVPSLVEAANGTTGFTQPFAGPSKYEPYAPAEATRPGQVNRRLGVVAADRIAHMLGLNETDAFSPAQYALFISGKGYGGDPSQAKLVDESVRILTNTTGNPLYAKVNGKVTRIVLGSYGLLVNTHGLLESPANIHAPTRQVNSVIEPGGYMPTWCRNNNAQRSLRMLYRSAYTAEAVYGNEAQQQSGAAQLAPNQKGPLGTIVGMSMAPALWIVNFALIWTLNPSLAANMPARWAPIPANVALAIAESRTGLVPYSKYESSFPHS
jgi:hypothetical protein